MEFIHAFHESSYFINCWIDYKWIACRFKFYSSFMKEYHRIVVREQEHDQWLSCMPRFNAYIRGYYDN